MTAEQFTYWLQGFFELSGPDAVPTPAQAKMIREHLATVFRKETPPLRIEPLPYYPPTVGGDSPNWTLLPTTTCSSRLPIVHDGATITIGKSRGILDEVSFC